MTYTGHVPTDGPTATRELRGITITKVVVGPMETNSYVLTCRRTGQQLMIDAGAEPDRLLEHVAADTLVAVLTTHADWDHYEALAEVTSSTGAVALVHTDDAAAMPVACKAVRGGDRVPFGATAVEVIHTGGHTSGSIVLAYRDQDDSLHLLTGDALFPGGVGTTRGDHADFVTLIDAVQRELFDAMPDDTWVYPGHGSDTTLGAERPQLREWRERGW